MQATAKRKIFVKTLDDDALGVASHQLATKLLAVFTPDIVIGIRTGGYSVASLMMPWMLQSIPLLPLTCRRQSTHLKNGFPALKTFLKKTPYFLTNRLRVIEHKRLLQKRIARPAYFSPDASEVSFLKQTLERINAKANVLIVDDAVDSGATLAAVVSIVNNASEHEHFIKTACITVTSDLPMIQPDFRLYDNVLCRFPWALDFRR